MRNPLANVNWFSTNLSLKLFSVGLFLITAVALFVPSTQRFLLGAAFLWSGLLAIQIFKLGPLPDAEPVDRNPTIQLHLE